MSGKKKARRKMSGTTKASDSASSMIIALVCFSIRPRGGICWCCSEHKKPIYIPQQQGIKVNNCEPTSDVCVKPHIQYGKHYIMLSFSHRIEFLFSVSVWIHMPGATSQSNSYVHASSTWQRCEKEKPLFYTRSLLTFQVLPFFFPLNTNLM